MSIRYRFPPARLPQSHYFLTVSRGERVRAFAVRPSVAIVALAAAPLLAVWAIGATAFITFHDQILAALVSRDAQMQTEYETRLSDTRAELDRVTSRQMLDQSAFEGKMRDLLARQARLESRSAMLAALANEAGANASALADAHGSGRGRPGGALQAIQAVGGATDGDLGPARSYAPAAPMAPAKPRPLEGGPDSLGRVSAPGLSNELAAAGDGKLEPNARVGLVGYSLDRVEREQVAALASVGKAAHAAERRFQSVIARAGLVAANLKAPGDKTAGGMGGPFIPASGDDAFGRAATEAARALDSARRLRLLMPHLPLRYPLTGEISMSSPFGYRPDPFLGRPALHPGVDLVQSFGAEIKATAAGRVIHAGPMGGYGNAVDIDHGNGIVTRYGHMSEVLAAEGQEVKAGDAIGRIGSTGRSTGPHLHYEVRLDGEPVDPERFLTAVQE